MTHSKKRGMLMGALLLLAFVLWTVLILCVDVQPVGVNGTNVGLAAVNTWFHDLTGVHMGLYSATDLLGLVPILVCIGAIILGLVQMIRRRSLKKVDADILLLGVYYAIVILCYFFFEKVIINYRPILIDGAMEASYPSSTTLLVLSVMPTLKLLVDRKTKSPTLKKVTTVFVVLFSAFMVICRLIAGVHWLTDIIGGILLSAGLYLLYRSVVRSLGQKA